MQLTPEKVDFHKPVEVITADNNDLWKQCPKFVITLSGVQDCRKIIIFVGAEEVLAFSVSAHGSRPSSRLTPSRISSMSSYPSELHLPISEIAEGI